MGDESTDGRMGEVGGSGSYRGYKYRYCKQLKRGQKYVFAYDLLLKLSQKEEDYHYPTIIKTYGNSQAPSQRCRGSQLPAPRVKPEFTLYPSELSKTVLSGRLRQWIWMGSEGKVPSNCITTALLMGRGSRQLKEPMIGRNEEGIYLPGLFIGLWNETRDF